MTVKTTKIQGGAEYALVPDRLKEFRENHPRALVETKPQVDGEVVVFEARIVKDKSDPESAEATGHSYGKLDGAKAFEKLETVAVGRALALLGYLNNGQVATTEEMDEYLNFRREQFDDAVAAVKTATKRSEFQEILSKLTDEQQRRLAPVVRERANELKEGKQDGTTD